MRHAHSRAARGHGRRVSVFDGDAARRSQTRRVQQLFAPQRNTVPARTRQAQPRAIPQHPFQSRDAGIWRAEELPFRLELLPVGFNLQTNVTVSTVDAGMAQDLVATPAMFEIGPSVPQLGKVSLPLSGFRVLSHINSNKVWDEFLVFQGASYFRAVAQHLLYGLSARGLAIDTGRAVRRGVSGFHALLDRTARRRAPRDRHLCAAGERVGHRRLSFTVQPGVETVMDVELTLFPARGNARGRHRTADLACSCSTKPTAGGSTTTGPRCTTPTACRSTRDPASRFGGRSPIRAKLQISTFTTAPPQGFGLVQRSRRAERLPGFREHVRAAAERLGRAARANGARVRWSSWRSPRGAKPTTTSWRFGGPRSRLPPGHPAHFAYRITWCAEPPLPKGLGKIVATRSGASLDGKRRVFLLDFVGAGEKLDGLRIDLRRLRRQDIQRRRCCRMPRMHGLRASFEIDPERRGSDRDAAAHHARRQARHGNLALSMDRQLNSAVEFEPRTAAGGMPPESPLAMPAQDLRRQAAARTRVGSIAAVLYARFILLAVTLGVTAYGIYQMLQVVRFASMTLLQGLMIFFFAVSLGWIAFAAGSVHRRRLEARAIRVAAPAARPGGQLTALVMPIYNEDPLRTDGGAAGDGRGAGGASVRTAQLRDRRALRLDQRRRLDPRDHRDRPAAQGARRRHARVVPAPLAATSRANPATSRTSSRRWGGRYEHMIVLDADSLIDAPHAAAAWCRPCTPTRSSGSCRPRRN